MARRTEVVTQWRASQRGLLAVIALAVTFAAAASGPTAAQQQYGTVGSYYFENPVCGGDQFFGRGGRSITQVAPVVRPIEGYAWQWVAYRAHLYWNANNQLNEISGKWHFATSR